MIKLNRIVGQFFKELNFCGLDIGSKKIKACLGQVKDAHNLELLSVHEVETRGFKDGSVNDLSEFSACIGSVLDAVTKKSQIRLREVYLGIGGDLVETRPSRAVIPLAERGNKVITPLDVKEARRQARLLGVMLDEEVLCDFVQQFKVDDVNIALNPVGLYGRKLEVEVVLVIAKSTRLHNIVKAVKQAGAEVNNIYFNGQALADTILDRRQRTEGAIILDLGDKTTQVMVFKEGLLKYYTKAPFGGQDLTEAIALKLDVSAELAEDIKRSYVRVRDERVPVKDDEILVKKDQAFIPVRREVLNEAVEPKVLELIELLRGAMEASGFKDQIRCGVVLVGGGALLPGLIERIESTLGLPVKLGRSIAGLNNAASYSVCTSVSEIAYKGSPRYVFDTRSPKDWLDSMKLKAEELCNEYF